MLCQLERFQWKHEQEKMYKYGQVIFLQVIIQQLIN